VDSIFISPCLYAVWMNRHINNFVGSHVQVVNHFEFSVLRSLICNQDKNTRFFKDPETIYFNLSGRWQKVLPSIFQKHLNPFLWKLKT
jgi:hypothetical protein